MEIFVKVVSENLRTGDRKIAATAFLTFVALDDDGKPTEVPQVIPETEEEKFLYGTAPERAERRKQHRLASKNLAGHLTVEKFWDTEA